MVWDLTFFQDFGVTCGTISTGRKKKSTFLLQMDRYLPRNVNNDKSEYENSLPYFLQSEKSLKREIATNKYLFACIPVVLVSSFEEKCEKVES